MRILTRGDVDGLASAVLLTVVEDIKEIKFAHPKDVQDGLVEATEEDIVVNLPYVPGCGLWFDHHISEDRKLEDIGQFKGSFKMAPSAARVIYDYYQDERLDEFKDMLEATDRLDSASLTMQDVTNPTDWILLGLTLDPRSGLGPEFRKYFRWLVEYIKELPLEKVLVHPEVKKRCDSILHEQEEFKKVLEETTKLDGNVIVTDFRGKKDLPVGNRFLVYTMYPEANVETRIFDGHQGATILAAGKSIFNRSCNVSCGELLAKYGGGGHAGAGTCQLRGDDVAEKIQEIIDIFKENKAES
ncbi:MAG: exopolyphosphatase [Planctomycetota bacterium]